MVLFLDIEKDFADAPALMDANDLVKYGLFPTRLAVHKARERGICPPELYLSERAVRFPRSGVVAWLLEKQKLGRPDPLHPGLHGCCAEGDELE